MNRKDCIAQAVTQLLGDRDANAMLNREGFVRICPLMDTPATPSTGETKSPDITVTFSIEEHAVLGNRLMAEFQGSKEFVA